jgi:hypothetical protein
MGKPEFSGSVTITTDSTMLDIGSVYAQITAGAAAVELKVGASALVNRSSLSIQAHPDNTGIVYVGFDNLVTSVKYGLALAGGAGATISLDSSGSLKVWAIGSAAGQLVGVIEGKG